MLIYRFQGWVGIKELHYFKGMSGVIMRRDACMGVARQSIEDVPFGSGSLMS